MRQSIKTSLVIAWVASSVFLSYGCSHKRYDRTTVTVDPNGVTTLEYVHIGATSIATDTNLSGLAIESSRGRIALDGATEAEDSIKASAVIGGVPVVIESGE